MKRSKHSHDSISLSDAQNAAMIAHGLDAFSDILKAMMCEGWWRG